MPLEQTEKSPAVSWQSTIRILAMLAGGMALVALSGWIFGIDSLKSLISGAVQMKPNTALGLLLAAGCLYARRNNSAPVLEACKRIAALMVVAIGAATLVEYVFDLSLGIDELLFRDVAAPFASAPGRMSPYSTVAFIGLGTALAVPARENWRPALYLGTIVCAAVGLTSLLGYLWNAQELITDQWLPPVALHTSLSFVLLSLGTILASGAIRVRRQSETGEKRGAVEAKVLFGFVGALALLCLGGGITYRMQINFDATEQLISEGRTGRVSLQRLYASVAEAESAQRNFMLLRQEKFRIQFLAATAQIGERFDTTQKAFADNAQAMALLQQLDSQIDTRLQSLAREMQTPDRPVADDSEEMQSIRAIVASLDQMSAALRTARIATLAHHRSYTLLALLITLSIATAALLTLFTSIVRDIRERARISRELNAAQHEAQRANLAKSEFLAAMSHEIRTPMNGVIGMLELLQQSSLVGQQSEMVQLTRESADGLLTIIDDILDFSKIEAGRLELEIAPMSVADVVEKNCALLNRLAERKHTVLTSYCDPAIPAVLMGDETRLRQVLVNLVSNAVKFSGGPEQSGRVSVRAQLVESISEQAIVEFIVADNGIGMNEATLSRLFTSFMQADVSTTRRYGGTGLGLAICKQLTTLMNGSISVRSTPHSGSSFTARISFGLGPQSHQIPPASQISGLPCLVVGGSLGLADDLATYLAASGARVARGPNADAIANWTRDQIPGTAVCILESGDEQPPLTELYTTLVHRADLTLGFVVVAVGHRVRNPRADAKGFVVIDGNALARQTLIDAVALASGRASPRLATDLAARNRQYSPPPSREDAIRNRRLILVAEDNDINQKVISQQLSLLGYCADVAANGRIAFERWQTGHYALLLADLHMPEMDGYALTVQIRLQERGRSHTPIVALTANALAGEADRCRSVGMDDYLSKPASLQAMSAVIGRWLPPGSLDAKESPARLPTLASAFNAQVLRALIGDDPELIVEVLGEFCVLAREVTGQLIQTCVSGNLTEAAATAHKFKSSAASVGATSIADLCASMERASQAGEWQQMKELTNAFQAEISALLDQMQSYLNCGVEEHRREA